VTPPRGASASRSGRRECRPVGQGSRLSPAQNGQADRTAGSWRGPVIVRRARRLRLDVASGHGDPPVGYNRRVLVGDHRVERGEHPRELGESAPHLPFGRPLPAPRGEGDGGRLGRRVSDLGRGPVPAARPPPVIGDSKTPGHGIPPQVCVPTGPLGKQRKAPSVSPWALFPRPFRPPQPDPYTFTARAMNRNPLGCDSDLTLFRTSVGTCYIQNDLWQTDFSRSDAQIDTDISIAAAGCVEKFARDVRKVRSNHPSFAEQMYRTQRII
jgi:hypothetical protein